LGLVVDGLGCSLFMGIFLFGAVDMHWLGINTHFCRLFSFGLVLMIRVESVIFF
jgi:hypothetical protein